MKIQFLPTLWLLFLLIGCIEKPLVIMSKNTPEETAGLQTVIDNHQTLLPADLHFLLDSNPTHPFDQMIHAAMAYQPLSTSDIQSAFEQITQQRVPDYKAASLLEALRLKEESFEENKTTHDFFRSNTLTESVDVPVLIDMATPYDGFNRSYFLQPFVAALLAAVGIPTILHGVHEVSPKKGMNTHKLLVAAGKNPLKSMAEVKADIESPDIGWGYIDQSVFCPALHDLIPVRMDMVKRPVLATIEKWLRPFSGQRTVCLTGFTHPPYKQKTIDLVHASQAYDQLILVRGVEGSTLLPFDRRAPFITSSNNDTPDISFVAPTDCGLLESVIENQDPHESLAIGIAGLTGSNPLIKQWLCYQVLAIAGAIGHTVNIHDLEVVILSGQGVRCWDDGCC